MKRRTLKLVSLGLVLAAFATNALLPYFAVYNLPAQAAEHAEAPSLFGEKILICTADGFKWVRWSDLINGKETPKPHPDFKCPLCYVATQGAKCTPPAQTVVSVYAPVLSVIVPRFAYDDAVKASIFPGGLYSRAPPLSIAA